MPSGGATTQGFAAGLFLRRSLRSLSRLCGRAWRRGSGLVGLLFGLYLLGRGGFTPLAIFGPWEGGELAPERTGSVAAAVTLLLLAAKLGERLARHDAEGEPWRRFLVETEGGGAL